MIDGGKSFDWGRTSEDYAKFRDIYPEEFYAKIADRGLCVSGQSVLDLGTGTGVLPRNMYSHGAKWTGVDASENQIKQAKILSEGMDIAYYAVPAEETDFPDGSFDVITACQCHWYFDHGILAPKLRRMLKPGGKILFLYMAWLPFEDRIAEASEKLVLKYNPEWSGAGETVHPIYVAEEYSDGFRLTDSGEYPLAVRFTRESWNGRMRACRGVGASMSDSELAEWEREHMRMLTETAPEEFCIKHYAAYAELTAVNG